MKPPFLGIKEINNISVKDIVDLIDKEVLFAARWQFKKDSVPRDKILSIFENLITRVQARQLLEPKVIYGHFECRKQENALLVTPSQDSKAKKTQRFDFPRQPQEPHLCAADFFPEGFVTMQLVTVGEKVIEEGVRLYNQKKYSDTFYLKGLAAQAAETLAEYTNLFIKRELGVSKDQGCRFSFGYPMAPHLMDQRKLYDLLGGSRIGVKITETYQLVPEYSTSAIIAVHSKAKTFRP